MIKMLNRLKQLFSKKQLAETKKATSSSSNLLHWVDENALLIMSCILMVIIPLWPKIPIWSPIEQYIVRVRLEDFFILATFGIYFLQLWRGKIVWKTPLTLLICANVLVGLISSLLAIFVFQTIPQEQLHVQKTFLHFFRYIQYFSLFFICFSALKTRRSAYLLLGVLAATLLGVTIYGYGQKYYYWPVYSTMNREFSKGISLVLTPHARVQSTFAGHYDMSAYLIMILPILFTLSLLSLNKKIKITLSIIFWCGTWLLIASASRAAFIGFVPVSLLTILIISLRQESWRSKLWFGLRHTLGFLFLLTFLFFLFGGDMAERIFQVLDKNPVVHDSYHQLNAGRKEIIYFIETGVFRQSSKPPEGTTLTEGVMLPSDEQPTARPSDVYVDVPNIVAVATTSATGVVTTTLVDKGPRTWSENASQYGLSLAIRLDTLWPRALEGFLKYPVFGQGYATLTKSAVHQFTEAESTDNNYLRTLGETGVLGFVTFYGVIVMILYLCIKNFFDRDYLLSSLAIGVFAACLGLLINAVLIDVFVASKVAETFWGVVGIYVGVRLLPKQELLATSSSSSKAQAPSVVKPQVLKRKKTPLSS